MTERSGGRAWEDSRFFKKARPSYFDSVDWDSIPETEIDPASLDILTYMARVESHTPWYLVHALVSTAGRKDPQLTDFLSIWPYQELWHGVALYDFLDRYYEGRNMSNPFGKTEDIISTRHQDTQILREASSWGERSGWAASAVMSHLTPKSFLASYATLARTNEQTTLYGYGRIAEKANHPVLSELIGHIKSQEAEHFNQYDEFAWKYLADDPVTQRTARWFMGHMWSTVGEGFRPRGEADQVIDHLFLDDEGKPIQLVDHMDESLQKLPGFSGTHFMREEVEQAARRLMIAHPRNL